MQLTCILAIVMTHARAAQGEGSFSKLLQVLCPALEGLTRYLAYVPASWQCSSHLQDMAIFVDDEKMCSGLRV